jgi:hypothetical protein
MRIWASIKGSQVEVHPTTYKVCLTEEVVRLSRFTLYESFDDGVGHIDHLVAYHPECTYVLEVVGHLERCSLVERVSGVR